jgi:hypothetical protein
MPSPMEGFWGLLGGRYPKPQVRCDRPAWNRLLPPLFAGQRTNGERRHDFNSATPLRAWKGPALVFNDIKPVILQFGRAPVGAVSSSGSTYLVPTNILQFGRAPVGAVSSSISPSSSAISRLQFGRAPVGAVRGSLNLYNYQRAFATFSSAPPADASPANWTYHFRIENPWPTRCSLVRADAAISASPDRSQ